ncbi:carboxypeptidase-like regulatory domain-containing protein [Tenacibaculum sp. M341]|uniref:carboxypeptidase-like regulatory domain-containing protein n=1 Tax=Tenacibaculum sp. M341 TaxID=2530339 RepID=UPI0010496FA5|nr:carboxypeptidase-like regulatory domain-containing protein [Tenacibaculum sp. M341]TCI90365.1 hypothetical protein EYW44_14115 [Tenacibaculum sp. M341]
MKKKSTILFFFFLLITVSMFSQQGIVTGTLEDEDGPLPGASVTIKGTKHGTETDFDGNYSIKCNVGDILIISFVGMETQEVRVTPDMFNSTTSETVQISYVATKKAQTDAYKKAIQKFKKDTIVQINTSERTYNSTPFYFEFERIKNIQVNEEDVFLTYFKPDIFFEIDFESNIGIQFIKNSNLHSLQNSFSQGYSLNNTFTYLAPETNTVFSYGPELNTLNFDGSAYSYDINGRLIVNGNGNKPIPYNNSLFKTSINNYNRVSFAVNNNKHHLKFNFSNKYTSDIFNRNLNSNNKLAINYKLGEEYNKNWSSSINYQTIKNNQPNINGFYNNLILNSWSTPISFSNSQGDKLLNNTQRSFSNTFNNPEWLLNNHSNKNTTTSFIATIKNKSNIDYDIQLNSSLSYNYSNDLQYFGLPVGTVGFDNGFLSTKKNILQNINANVNFEYDIDYTFKIKSIVNYNYEHLNFGFEEFSNFSSFPFNNAMTKNSNDKTIFRNKLQLLNQLQINIDRILNLKLTNNSYYSSIQNNAWFLSSFNAELNLRNWLKMYDINTFTISANASFDINDASLYFNNQNHNSLIITPQQSASYTTNNDLFIQPNLDLEKKELYEINAAFEFPLFNYNTSINFSYYNSTTKGSVHPILSNNTFTLDNVADIKNTGFEFIINSNIELVDDFYYKPIISFSTYNTKVLKLLNTTKRIPTAGFSSVSENLIEGQPAGVIVGSAYERDANNRIIIGDNGFPLVATAPKIIGNPIPDFSIGFQNNFTWDRLTFAIDLDIQKGGDIWNGTQNVLNYLGTSKQSATERTITDFIFNGVNTQGNENSIPVDFYNPNNSIIENRFVRYGFDGIAEEAIVDASYINLRTINVNYQLIRDKNKRFFRELTLGFYANNIATWSNFNGHSPYSTLYGNSGTRSLNFFNIPLQTEIGFNLSLKI